MPGPEQHTHICRCGNRIEHSPTSCGLPENLEFCRECARFKVVRTLKMPTEMPWEDEVFDRESSAKERSEKINIEHGREVVRVVRKK